MSRERPIMSRSTTFQNGHVDECAVLVTSRNLLTQAVESVECQLCVFHGREQPDTDAEAPIGRKRARKSTAKSWTGPFRKELFTKHHKDQHPEAWAKYQTLRTREDRKKFLTAKQRTIGSYFEQGSDTLTFKVSRPIVETLIGDMFFHPEDDLDDDDAVKLINKANALKLFKADKTGESYDVIIKNPTRFWIALDNTSIGLSFRQTSKVMEQNRARTKNTQLSGLNDHMVGQFVRVLVGVNLQIIADFLADNRVWSFALAGDGTTHRSVSFFGIRIRISVCGVLYNLHLIVLPFFMRHTANNIAAHIIKVLDSLFPGWRDKLLAVSTDGENTMTGRLTGIVTQVVAQAAHPVLRVWCVPHQQDLAVKGALQEIDDGGFVKTAHAFSVHLRIQYNLQSEMGSTCPKDTNQWTHFTIMLGWMLEKRLRLLRHIEEKEPVQAPSPTWWVEAAAIAPIGEACNITFVLLQNRMLVLSQQRRIVEDLMNVCNMMNIAMVDVDDSFNELLPPEFYRKGRWWIRIESVVEHIEDQGSFASILLAALPAAEKDRLLYQIARYAVHLVEGMSGVQAERDSNNVAAGVEAPPVMPVEIAALRPSSFVKDIVDPHRTQLAKFWTEEDIEMIEREQRHFRDAVRNEPALKARIDKHDALTNFNEAWQVLGGRFMMLRQFLGGLATAFANTTSVESDFSILKWEKDSYRSSLTNLSIEGIFQAKQRELLFNMPRDY